MANDEYYDQVRSAIKQAMRKGDVVEDVVWAVVEGVTTGVDAITEAVDNIFPFFGVAATGLQGVYDAATGKKKGREVAPNPWFIFNGHDEADSPYTRKYMRNRGYKKGAGGAIATAGKVQAAVMQTATGGFGVDVGGILQHGNALASTGVHLLKLHAIAKSYKQSKTLCGWFELIQRMKAIKSGVRGTAFAGSAIPIPLVGVATGILTAGAKLGVKASFLKVCNITALDIHWRAFQEQAIGGAFGARGKIGPASRIMYEIFARRTATRIFGKYDVDRLIHEPAGWEAVADKLLLI